MRGDRVTRTRRCPSSTRETKVWWQKINCNSNTQSPTPYVSKGRALSNDNLQKPIQLTCNGGKVLDNHCIVVDGITRDVFCFFLCL